MDRLSALPWIRHVVGMMAWLVIFSFFFRSCKEDPQLWTVDSAEQVIADFILTHPEEYSEFGKLMDLTGMDPLLSIRGPYTVFLPGNDAMLDYYEMKNVNGLDDFSEEFRMDLILTHLVAAFIGTNDIGLGALVEVNGLGDYLASEFEGSDIVISKESKIIKRDVLAANGVIQIIDKVLDPVTTDVFNAVKSDPAYSIFTEGLELTGLKDTLQTIEFPYGDKIARTRFTILAVADTIYNRYGISDVQDLIEWCGGSNDSVDIIEDEFYRYMEYHCLNGAHYLSDLETGVIPVLSKDNNVDFTIDTDYKINYDRLTKEYTGFNIPASNTPAKNGTLHSIDDLLPAVEPKPAYVRFETTDFFDLQQEDCYGRYFGRFFDGVNTFEKIKWRGDYLLYYNHGKPNSSLQTDDCLSIQGWWEISITFPKVMKGKYEVFVYQPGWNDVTDAAIYLDGERTKYLYTGPYGTGVGGSQKAADADFKTTAEHTITLRNVSAGMLFWDYVEFVPVNNP